MVIELFGKVFNRDRSSWQIACIASYMTLTCLIIWGFPAMGYPQNGWFTMQNPNLKWMIWGYPYFRKPPSCILHHLKIPHHVSLSIFWHRTVPVPVPSGRSQTLRCGKPLARSSGGTPAASWIDWEEGPQEPTGKKQIWPWNKGRFCPLNHSVEWNTKVGIGCSKMFKVCIHGLFDNVDPNCNKVLNSYDTFPILRALIPARDHLKPRPPMFALDQKWGIQQQWTRMDD